MKRIIRILAVIVIVALMVSLAACSSNPCEDCGDTPTKGYKNEKSGDKEYYCADCSSECNLCYDDAAKHYTGGMGIIFICNDCYEELESYGWVD